MQISSRKDRSPFNLVSQNIFVALGTSMHPLSQIPQPTMIVRTIPTCSDPSRARISIQQLRLKKFCVNPPKDRIHQQVSRLLSRIIQDQLFYSAGLSRNSCCWQLVRGARFGPAMARSTHSGQSSVTYWQDVNIPASLHVLIRANARIMHEAA